MWKKEERKKRMMDDIHFMSPLQRMINSPGLDESFEYLKKEFPQAIIHEYPCGSHCEDWTVPKSWEVKEGFIKNEAGETIASIEENKLFVAAYSEEVDGWFTKEEISKHLRCHPTEPDAYFLEHRNAYNYKLVDWGITMPSSRWNKLPADKKYYVKIVTKLSDKSMKVGELFLQGTSEQVISISAHIDELCNDNLSGCVVAMELMRKLAALPVRKYSYQMLLIPETIGTFFYVKNNLERVKNTLGMLNLETVGAGEELCLKKALTQDSYVELVLKNAFNYSTLAYKEIDFFSGYGNDERVYEWPTLGIPGVAIQRYPFKQYHAGTDTPAIINEDYLMEVVGVSESFFDMLEKDYCPEFTTVTPPWLTKQDLYYDSKDEADKFHQFMNLLLFNVNGKNSLSKLVGITGLNFYEIHDYLEQFIKKGFVKRNEL